VGLYDATAALTRQEWERFWRGVRGLDPEQERLRRVAAGGAGRGPEEPATITIPGWDDVIKISPRERPTGAQLDEYYRARRVGARPDLPDAVTGEIDRRRAQKERMRTSAQLDYARAWGDILTAFDNVQDYLSAVATTGRLALWAGPRAAALLGAVGVPGAGKLAGRFVPGLGWVILASDLLNLLGLLGTGAMFGFGMLCLGPSGALAAGVPAFLFKRAAKSEAWNMARRNPFGRKARLDRAARAAGRLPGFGNLVEVLQTTEQLFGYGVSFGAVVAMLTEAGSAAELLARGEGVTVDTAHAAESWTRAYRQATAGYTTAEQLTVNLSSKVVATTPAILREQDVFTDQEHIEALTAYRAALPEVVRALDLIAWEDVLPALLDAPLAPLVDVGPTFERVIAEDGDNLATGRAWPLPGAPVTATPRELLTVLPPLVAGALTRYLYPRQWSAEGTYYGDLVGEIAETWALHLTRNVEGVRFQLAPDFALLAGLAEDGFLLSPHGDVAQLWQLWQDARAHYEQRGDRPPPPAWWLTAAEAHGAQLVKLLPPTSPWPPEWLTWSDAIGGELAP